MSSKVYKIKICAGARACALVILAVFFFGVSLTSFVFLCVFFFLYCADYQEIIYGLRIMVKGVVYRRFTNQKKNINNEELIQDTKSESHESS